MAVPTFVSAGNGAASSANADLVVPSAPGTLVGDLIVIQFFVSTERVTGSVTKSSTGGGSVPEDPPESPNVDGGWTTPSGAHASGGTIAEWKNIGFTSANGIGSQWIFPSFGIPADAEVTAFSATARLRSPPDAGLGLPDGFAGTAVDGRITLQIRLGTGELMSDDSLGGTLQYGDDNGTKTSDVTDTFQNFSIDATTRDWFGGNEPGLPTTEEVNTSGDIAFRAYAFGVTNNGVDTGNPPSYAAIDHITGTVTYLGPPTLPTVNPPAGFALALEIEEEFTNGNQGRFRQMVFTKIATASEPASYTLDLVGGSVSVIAGRAYAFRGQNGDSLVDPDEVVSNGGTSIVVIPSVTTLENDSLLVALVSLNNNIAIGPAAGGSGGVTWAEPVADFQSASGTDCALQLQTATKATAGATSGYFSSLVSTASWISHAFALAPVPASANIPFPQPPHHGASW